MIFKKKKVNIDKIKNTIYSKNVFKRYLNLMIGLILLSSAFNMFFLPNDIVFGGVSGLSIITKKLFGWNPSIFIFVSSVILLIVSYFALGKEKTKGSVLGSLLFPVLVEVTSFLPTISGKDNMLVIALFGGAMYGLGAGLVFKAGFTTGGTDIINQITSHYLKVSMGTSLLMCDGLIVLSGIFVYDDILKLMYALIVLYIINILTDKVLLGISESKAFYIVTDKENEVQDYILNVLNHGVTIFDAKGGYNNSKQKVLFCVVPTKEYFKVKEGINEIDNDAFFVVTDAYEVNGGE